MPARTLPRLIRTDLITVDDVGLLPLSGRSRGLLPYGARRLRATCTGRQLEPASADGVSEFKRDQCLAQRDRFGGYGTDTPTRLHGLVTEVETPSTWCLHVEVDRGPAGLLFGGPFCHPRLVLSRDDVLTPLNEGVVCLRGLFVSDSVVCQEPV